jgi:hypothetical protein
MRIGLALRAFFKALWDREFAASLARILHGDAAKLSAERPATPSPPAVQRAGRSEALTLLAALQREARFVDMVREPLADYSDAQVGAAARDVLRDCGQLLDRFFGLTPASQQEEGHEVEVGEGYDAGSVRVTGNVTGDPPYRGRLIHHGWVATRCDVPAWTGSERARFVVAPQEVEVQ